MKTISADRYTEGVYSIYEEQPAYETGHDGSDGKCDCIGMCRGASEREGVTGIKNFSGTNQAARKTILDLHQISGAEGLKKGMVVLKVRDKDDPDMPLPDKYREGGKEYDPVLGETNFTHIGSVTRTDPLEITHMTSPTAKKDTKIGKWTWAGRLPWVETDGGGDQPEPETQWAVVYAEKGSTVKMRAKPSTKCRLYWDVPIGSEVILEEWGDEWSRIIWAGQEGYMMSKFLIPEGNGGIGDRYTVTIPGLTYEQAEELCMQWSGATMRKE